MENFCAIDFGTSNSTLGVYKNGESFLVDLEHNHKTLPSAIFYETDTGEIVFGRQALDYYKNEYNGRLIRSFKSILGSRLMKETTQIMHQQVSFLSIIESFLKHMKNTAEKKHNITLDNVVLGRPIHFVDDDKEKDMQAQNHLLEAAKRAGFKNIKFQYEPIAAALKYEQTLKKEELVLIVDIGGGTSDISIVKLSPEKSKNKDRSDDCIANTGIHIGGTDFDTSLNLNNVMPLLGYKQTLTNGLNTPNSIYTTLSTWHRISFAYTRKFNSSISPLKNQFKDIKYFDRLQKVIDDRLAFLIAMNVEDSKIHLSNTDLIKKDFEFIEDGLFIDFTKGDLSKSINNQIQKILNTIDECLCKSKLKKQDIDSIFLTGGPSKMKIIRDRIQNHFENTTIHNQDAFSSVATGLLIDAKNKFA